MTESKSKVDWLQRIQNQTGYRFSDLGKNLAILAWSVEVIEQSIEELNKQVGKIKLKVSRGKTKSMTIVKDTPNKIRPTEGSIQSVKTRN